VPVLAFDAAAVEGRLGLRLAGDGEALGEFRPLAPGQIVIADEQRALAVLFGDVAGDVGVNKSTRRIVLVAIGVAGVPPVSVEEALWTAAETVVRSADR
jgi:DNA/RNA-binding domain of Phe-tRNA-synthetase-like protein